MNARTKGCSLQKFLIANSMRSARVSEGFCPAPRKGEHDDGSFNATQRATWPRLSYVLCFLRSISPPRLSPR
jgi:hypothetical protein